MVLGKNVKLSETFITKLMLAEIPSGIFVRQINELESRDDILLMSFSYYKYFIVLSICLW